MTHELGVNDRVIFLGAVSSDMLPACYAAADIFVHPNRVDGRDFEGFGLVFLEAAAAGLPVIAGQTGGAPEAIEAGKTGLLVSGTDVAEMVRALRCLLANPDGRRAMGRAGRERAVSQFSWERAADLTRQAHERAATTYNLESSERMASEV
jgi:phosphatidylinositol alpha-1,6-mannosyltransferase